MASGQNRPGIHDVQRVERLLDLPHGLHDIRAMFADRVFAFVLTDPVLRRACSAEFKGRSSMIERSRNPKAGL